MNQAKHAKGYSDFTQVDDRCIGGKTLIVQHMKNHYGQLTETKPQLKIEEPKRYIHETRKPVHKQKNKLIDENLEVKVAFRKVAMATKGYTDHKEPVSEKLKGNLKGRYEKEKKHEIEEHNLNMNSMKKKLNQKGKQMKDRKKDPTDPIANPALLFRRDKELPNKKVEYLSGMPGGSRLIINETDVELKKRLDNKSNVKGAFMAPLSSLNAKSGVDRAGRPSSSKGNLGFEMEKVEGDQSAPGNKQMPSKALGNKTGMFS